MVDQLLWGVKASFIIALVPLIDINYYCKLYMVFSSILTLIYENLILYLIKKNKLDLPYVTNILYSLFTLTFCGHVIVFVEYTLYLQNISLLNDIFIYGLNILESLSLLVFINKIRKYKNNTILPLFIKNNITNEKCSICLEELKDCITTTCKHSFHEKCINELFNNNMNNCPMCRENIK